ncbi:Lrp/AsnC ligand binding domain-containing protein [Candidatus Woesearchaeota archaeon]|nr:Lrp/AsnC ligand binding domain-containing protein [Candidatus Woesearchaeota archaeon]
MEIAFILIKAGHGKAKLVCKALAKHAPMAEIHEVYGQYDLVAKVVADDRHALNDFIRNTLMITEGIDRSETLLVTEIEEDEEAAGDSRDENAEDEDKEDYEADGELD